MLEFPNSAWVCSTTASEVRDGPAMGSTSRPLPLGSIEVAGRSAGGDGESAVTRVRFGGACGRPDGCADGSVSGTNIDGGSASACLDVLAAGVAPSVDLIVSLNPCQTTDHSPGTCGGALRLGLPLRLLRCRGRPLWCSLERSIDLLVHKPRNSSSERSRVLLEPLVP